MPLTFNDEVWNSIESYHNSNRGILILIDKLFVVFDHIDAKILVSRVGSDKSSSGNFKKFINNKLVFIFWIIIMAVI